MVRRVLGYIWGMVVRPVATLDELARQTSIRPAVILVVFTLVLIWLNWLIYAALGYDWLGTRRELPDPTYVGFFGRLAVGVQNYTVIFLLVVSPLLALLGPVIVPGLAHVLSKLWGGQGSFEQMVNTLGYAQVPSLIIQALLNDMVLAGVPANLLAGHPYAFTAAMNGEFGPVWSTVVWVYVIGIYTMGTGLWIVTLGTIAISRVQRIPWWAAAVIMTFAYLLWFFGVAGSIVR